MAIYPKEGFKQPITIEGTGLSFTEGENLTISDVSEFTDLLSNGSTPFSYKVFDQDITGFELVSDGSTLTITTDTVQTGKYIDIDVTDSEGKIQRIRCSVTVTTASSGIEIRVSGSGLSQPTSLVSFTNNGSGEPISDDKTNQVTVNIQEVNAGSLYIIGTIPEEQMVSGNNYTIVLNDSVNSASINFDGNTPFILPVTAGGEPT